MRGALASIAFVVCMVGLLAVYIHWSALGNEGLGFWACDSTYCSGPDPALIFVAFVWGMSGMIGVWKAVDWLRSLGRQTRPASSSL